MISVILYLNLKLKRITVVLQKKNLLECIKILFKSLGLSYKIIPYNITLFKSDIANISFFTEVNIQINKIK